MPTLRLHERHRSKLIPLTACGLAAFYFSVFYPLKERAEALDKPLEAEWHKLAAALHEPRAGVRVDFAAIDGQLGEIQESLIALQTVERKAASRVDLGEDMRVKLHAPFQLVDYQNERQRTLEELNLLSKQQQVALEPAVTNGYPEYTADLKHPALLWAELAFIKHLLSTAMNCKVSAIHSVSVPVAFADAQPTNSPIRLNEIPVQVELTGSTASVAKLLQSLALRAKEITSEGLPPAATNKPALFVDKLMLRRQSPDKPDEVRMSLRVAGFTFYE